MSRARQPSTTSTPLTPSNNTTVNKSRTHNMAGIRGTWGKGFAAVAAVCLLPGFLTSFFTARPASRYSRLSHCLRQDLGNLAGPVILLSVLFLGVFCFLCLRGAQRAIFAIHRFSFMLLESRVRRTPELRIRRPYVPYIRDDLAYTFGRPPRTFAPLSDRRKRMDMLDF
ncbi:hypothetical protein K440DRAFT_313125 [Wilcoxina mikolae CBS 423.85]|nr:hypothetical protein K440DRAFT_313125 [Wilcoxina mikolae CBS 423.85]